MSGLSFNQWDCVSNSLGIQQDATDFSLRMILQNLHYKNTVSYNGVVKENSM